MTRTTDPTMALRDRLVSRLVDKGALTSPEWRAAFRAVPRHRFVSRFCVPGPVGHYLHYDATDPDRRGRSLAAAYDDVALVTRFDAKGVATSSSTTPSLMAIMLEALGVGEGHRVLEIGTGTGYNAALLCHRVGEENVTTVDIDPEVADDARNALAAFGFRPTVVCGNGAAGYPDRAPYDRVIATCGVSSVPYPWVRQVRQDGSIVVNVGFGLVRLLRSADGTATGGFLRAPAGFVAMRESADHVVWTGRDVLRVGYGEGAVRGHELPEGLHHPTVAFLASVLLPGVHRVTVHRDPAVHVLVDPVTGSWVRAEVTAPRHVTLVEDGPRRLWDELCRMVGDWHRLGRPAHHRYGLTVTEDRQWLWLDRADGEYRWEIPIQPR
ncbi:protein-L-isoaspartate O-methyltransferase [Longimycelium tulufanense]|uniref:Protein-L-isoaspartate O-methyltransferase n=1 Tax=Longimycelium tulufanense TaxID=907463 RepID=A0A8J3C9K8_9PSEU|nr:methyltransferase domain-containing protein [Longimycelium tulufanense]GGM61164.1 protein-L-isoaspartate O-methyltransferase [Longimycelium tulufanense]